MYVMLLGGCKVLSFSKNCRKIRTFIGTSFGDHADHHSELSPWSLTDPREQLLTLFRIQRKRAIVYRIEDIHDLLDEFEGRQRLPHDPPHDEL
jgi:hypothetical protein